MLDDGLFTRFPKPDYGFAAHVDPGEVGTVTVKQGVTTSASDTILITFKGVGAHGGIVHGAAGRGSAASSPKLLRRAGGRRDQEPPQMLDRPGGRYEVHDQAHDIVDRDRLDGNPRRGSGHISRLGTSIVDQIKHIPSHPPISQSRRLDYGRIQGIDDG